MIAFIEPAKPLEALGRLVVIDEKGTEISESLVHPISPDGGNLTSMRFVESLEWFGDQALVVGGSINPSTSEYLVFDVSSRRLVYEFYSDGAAPAFSTTGKDLAYTSGCPHFSPLEQCDWKLFLDGKPLELAKVGLPILDFTVGPSWSADGRSLSAIYKAATQGKEQSQNVLFWREGDVSTITLPADPNAKFQTSWQADELFVTSSQFRSDQAIPEDRAWSVNADHHSLTPISASAIVERRAAAEALRRKLDDFVRTLSGGDANLWCLKCVLSSVPRRASVND
jgi:hypothetical protein